MINSPSPLCMIDTRTNRIPFFSSLGQTYFAFPKIRQLWRNPISNTWLKTKPSEMVLWLRTPCDTLPKAPVATWANCACNRTRYYLTWARILLRLPNPLLHKNLRQKHGQAGMFTPLCPLPRQAHVFPSGWWHSTAEQQLAVPGRLSETPFATDNCGIPVTPNPSSAQLFSGLPLRLWCRCFLFSNSPEKSSDFPEYPPLTWFLRSHWGSFPR